MKIEKFRALREDPDHTSVIYRVFMRFQDDQTETSGEAEGAAYTSYEEAESAINEISYKLLEAGISVYWRIDRESYTEY